MLLANPGDCPSFFVPTNSFNGIFGTRERWIIRRLRSVSPGNICTFSVPSAKPVTRCGNFSRNLHENRVLDGHVYSTEVVGTGDSGVSIRSVERGEIGQRVSTMGKSRGCRKPVRVGDAIANSAFCVCLRVARNQDILQSQRGKRNYRKPANNSRSLRRL